MLTDPVDNLCPSVTSSGDTALNCTAVIYSHCQWITYFIQDGCPLMDIDCVERKEPNLPIYIVIIQSM